MVSRMSNMRLLANMAMTQARVMLKICLQDNNGERLITKEQSKVGFIPITF